MTDTAGFAAGLTPSQRETLHTLARPVSFPPGHRLFDEGQAADRFWILSRGSVALDVQVPGRPAPVIETLGPGDLLGWSWLFEPYLWHLGARALAPVDAEEFEASAVRAACERDTGFGYAVARAVAAVVGQRLRATRIRLLDLYGPPHGGGR
ncbi:cyclic nucleotide-binding domain-containing protein [Streptomyces eurythermus]